MTNVVDFTKFKADRETEKFDELSDDIEMIDDLSASLAMNVVVDVIDVLSEIGFDVENNPRSVLNLLALMEATRSLVYAISDLPHPFDAVTKALFVPDESVELDYDIVLSNFLDDLYK